MMNTKEMKWTREAVNYSIRENRIEIETIPHIPGQNTRFASILI